MNRANALALATALALGGTACDASKARPIEPTADVNDCSRCHGYPPPANGPFLMPTTTAHPTSQNCNGCHPGTVQADNVSIVPGGLHMNGVVDVTGGHAMPYTAQHAAAALAGIASCTACHGADYGGGSGPSCNGCHAAIAAGGPDWKANCTFCHGTRTAGVTTATSKAAPPQAVDATADQTRANPSVGAHQAHLVAGTIAPAMPCGSCHAVPGPADLTHFTGGGAPATVAFGALATKGAAGAAYAAGACAVYCHGAGTEFGSPSGKTSPQWTSTGVGCTTCHGNPPATGPAISGQTAHAFHVTGRSVACATCHPVPPGQLASHVNGTKDVVVQPAGGGSRTIAGWDCTACHDALGVAAAHPLPYVADHTSAALASISSCTSCHGADYGGGSAQSCNACHASIAASGPDWKTNCTFCHGTRTAGVTTATAKSAPPQSVVVTADQTRTNPKIGAHQAHLVAGSIAGATPCTSCHAVPAPAQALTHFTGNGAPGAIAFDATATKGVTGAAYAGGTCNVYCHGAGTEFGSPAAKASPAWTSTGVTCTTCHGYPPASHSASSTNCNGCHSGTVNADNTTINVAGGLHVNGVKDATSPHPAGYGAASQHGYEANRIGLSSCKGCHGATLTGGSGPSCASCHDTTVAGWDTSCTFCHGNRTTGRASPPVDTQGRSVTTNVSVGVHASHVGTTMAASIACTECHPSRSASVITDASHIDGNGVAEVAFGTLARTGSAPAAYSRASATSATCASTYCHGTFTGGVNSGAGATMSWTSTTQVTCSSCHPSSPTTGRHTLHISRYGCGTCHPSYTSTAANAAIHVNGVKNVTLPNGGTFNPSTRTCSSFGCHGNEVWQ